MSSRSYNSIRNFIVGFLNKILWVLVPFVFRTIIIYFLGSEYLGLNSLFSSILQVLNVADIGLGNAIQSSMYKPIANKDYAKGSALLSFYKKIYRVIGFVILSVGVILMPFVPKFINGTCPVDVNVYVLFGLYVLNTAVSYIYFAYSSILINASQRMDLAASISLASKLITSVLQLIALIVFRDIILYTSCNIVCILIQNTANFLLVKKKYPEFISTKGNLDTQSKNLIFKNSLALIFQKVGSTLSTSFDTIIISSFMGLTSVAIYGNYSYVCSAVGQFIALIFESIIASVGDSIAQESVKKNYKNFIDISYLNFWIVGWCSICLICIMQNFQYIWTSGSMMLNNFELLSIVMCFYFSYSRKTVNTYKDALGLWYADKYKPIVGGIFNLIMNIILVKVLGIAGVVLSTVASYVLIEIPWENHVLFNKYFDIKLNKYYLSFLKTFIKTILIASITYFLCLQTENTFAGMLIKCLICLIIPNMLFYILDFNNHYKHFIKTIFKRLIKSE